MDAENLTDLCREATFFAGLPEEVRRRLAAIARLKPCSAGTVLFREGERHNACYIVRKGHIALEMCIAGRGCTRLLTLAPGEFLAWSTLVGDGRMTATAVAQDEVELIELPGAELVRLCESDHELGYWLMRRLAAALSKRLLATRLQLLDMFAADASGGQGERR